MFEILIVIFGLFICALLSSFIAGIKGGSKLIWFIIGYIFGPFGLAAAIFLSGKGGDEDNKE